MELTWIAIAASLLMGGGALMIFIWAVRHHHFSSFEDVKYQVFWSDPEPLRTEAKTNTTPEERENGSTQDK